MPKDVLVESLLDHPVSASTRRRRRWRRMPRSHRCDTLYDIFTDWNVSPDCDRIIGVVDWRDTRAFTSPVLYQGDILIHDIPRHPSRGRFRVVRTEVRDRWSREVLLVRI